MPGSKRVAPCAASLTTRVRCPSLLLIGEQPPARLLKTSYAPATYVTFQATLSLYASRHPWFGWPRSYRGFDEILTERGHWRRPTSFQTETPPLIAPNFCTTCRALSCGMTIFARDRWAHELRGSVAPAGVPWQRSQRHPRFFYQVMCDVEIQICTPISCCEAARPFSKAIPICSRKLLRTPHDPEQV